jgi:hypothetical protein
MADRGTRVPPAIDGGGPAWDWWAEQRDFQKIIDIWHDLISNRSRAPGLVKGLEERV